MPDQLGTLAGVKTRLGITDVTDDALLTTLLESVSAFVQDRCRRRLLPENAATYVVDVGIGSQISIPRGIRAVTALDLATSDQPDSGGTYATSIALADVLLRPSSLFRRPGWPADTILIRGASARITRPTLNGARVTGDYDFAATPLPIVSVVEEAVGVAYNAREGGTGEGVGEGNATVPDWASYFPDGSPQAATLARYTVGSKVGIG